MPGKCGSELQIHLFPWAELHGRRFRDLWRVREWLAAAAQARTLLVEYRLAPEHLYPAAHDDCLRPCCGHSRTVRNARLRQIAQSLATRVERVSRSQLQLLPSDREPPAKSVILFSPFVDLAVNGESWERNHGRDPLLTAEVARGCAALYAPSADARSPGLSPIFDDLSQLPPIQIHASSADPAYDDAARLAEHVDRAGVPLEFHVWSDVPPFWFLFHDNCPQLDIRLRSAGSFSSRQ